MPKLTKFVTVGLVLVALFAAGCNTFRGVGRDIEKGGEKIQDVSK